MKHIARLIAVLLVLCTAAACADPAQINAGGIYTVTCDDAEFTIDTTSYTDENTASYQWLFMIYNDETIVDASCESIESYTGLSLYSADEATREAYLVDLIDSFSDSDAEYIAMRTVSEHNIPFYIIKCSDDQGEYYMAETVVKGYALDFMCYPCDAEGVREIDYATLLDVLDTFTPAA